MRSPITAPLVHPCATATSICPFPPPRVHNWPLGGFWAGGTGATPGRCPWDGDDPTACLFQPHLLPTVEGKDPGLKYISPDTVRGLQPLPSHPEGLPACSLPSPPFGDTLPPQLAAVLTGHFSSFIESSIIADCRYPYEYEGGHVKVRTPLRPWGREEGQCPNPTHPQRC